MTIIPVNKNANASIAGTYSIGLTTQSSTQSHLNSPKT